MVKYFCNRCLLEISKGRYAVAVKDPSGEQKQYHFCRTCYAVVQRVMDGMDDVVQPKAEAVAESEKVPTGPVEDSKVDAKPITQLVEDAQQEVVAWPKGKQEEEKLEPAPTETEQVKADPAPTVTEDVSTDADKDVKASDSKDDEKEEKKEPEQHPIVTPRVKPVIPAKTGVTVSSFHQQSQQAKSSEVKEPSRKIQLSESLPKRPTRRANLDNARRVLIDYYREVSATTTIQRHKIDYNNYYYTLNRYGSIPIKERYSEDAIKEKEWLDESGNKIDSQKLLSLYAAGFSIEELADREFHIDSMLVQDILTYYTGL